MRAQLTALALICLTTGPSAQVARKQFVRPPAPTTPYSLAIEAGGVIYVAGHLPTNAQGALVEGDITVQAQQVFSNLQRVLEQAGSSLSQVVSVTVMLQNASDFAALDRVYAEQFMADPPARTTIIGDMVLPGALLEIAVTAVPAGVARTVILPEGWQKPTSPYSYAIKSGDTLWSSGLVARNGRTNTQVTGDVPTQTTTIMTNLGEILEAAGMGYGDVVQGRVALKDMTNFQAMNEAYRVTWDADRPARVSCQASPPGTYDVEITFVAIKGASPREVIIPNLPDGSPGSAGQNFSPAIRVGNRLFISGTTGTNDGNRDDMEAQTVETLARLGRSLEAAGFDFGDVVASDVFITDVGRFGNMNTGYRPRFQSDPPVRATVGVDRLAGQTALVEIMLMAVK